MKLKKGDQITVTLGKDKGRVGKVERVWPKKNQVLVQGLNVYKRHLKKRDEKNPGGIIEFSRPLAVSKVALVCPHCHKSTRVHFDIKGNEKVRICQKCHKHLYSK